MLLTLDDVDWKIFDPLQNLLLLPHRYAFGYFDAIGLVDCELVQVI